MSELFHNHNLGLDPQLIVPETDFIGFTFDGVHSSDLGIVRTSEGARYETTLLPTLEDKTVQIPGGDGMYFFGSYYTQKPFDISFAFDSMTEEQLTRMRVLFGSKKPKNLIFDEMPFKVYKVKVGASATIKHIPFKSGATGRVYKGEGTVSFTAYTPYARSRFKFLDEIEDDMEIRNQNEWKDAARMYASANVNGKNYDSFNEGICNLYNAGDKETDFLLDLSFVNGAIAAGNIKLEQSGALCGQLKLKEVVQKGSDTKIRFNSKMNLIEGLDADGNKTGNIYNEFIAAGTFFKIPMGEDLIMQVQQASNDPIIQYDYLYY